MFSCLKSSHRLLTRALSQPIRDEEASRERKNRSLVRCLPRPSARVPYDVISVEIVHMYKG